MVRLPYAIKITPRDENGYNKFIPTIIKGLPNDIINARKTAIFYLNNLNLLHAYSVKDLTKIDVLESDARIFSYQAPCIVGPQTRIIGTISLSSEGVWWKPAKTKTWREVDDETGRLI